MLIDSEAYRVSGATQSRRKMVPQANHCHIEYKKDSSSLWAHQTEKRASCLQVPPPVVYLWVVGAGSAPGTGRPGVLGVGLTPRLSQREAEEAHCGCWVG